MNGHPTREEDFDLYALGVLEGDEKQAIESHVASCTDCSRKLARAQGRIALLAFAAPQIAPSVAVKQRLMQQVRAAAEAAAPGRAQRQPLHAGTFLGRWWTALLVPAAAVLALVTVFLWNENHQLDQQLATLRAAMQQQQQQLQEARAIDNLIADPNTVIVPLAQQPNMPKGTAHVIYNLKLGTLLYEGQMEPAPAATSYQLWLVPAQGNPISAGVFNPVSGQPNRWTMKIPPGVLPKAFAVTLEPAGGKPQPTGPKVLVGAAS
jgi:anti-sigma-K factor RskA